jgi:hypothetical protein
VGRNYKCVVFMERRSIIGHIIGGALKVPVSPTIYFNIRFKFSHYH